MNEPRTPFVSFSELGLKYLENVVETMIPGYSLCFNIHQSRREFCCEGLVFDAMVARSYCLLRVPLPSWKHSCLQIRKSPKANSSVQVQLFAEN
jgi:hypothetical protein